MSSFRKLKRLSHQTLIVGLLLLTVLPSAECSFRLCGFKLTMTLQALCKNKLCGGFVVNTLAGQSPPVEEEMEGDERTALLLYTPSYQKRSGIATECCEKRCSLNYLKTYCCAGFSNTKPASTKRSAYLNEDYT
uniref:Insulin-like domain-containing protein n=1 Tax=Panagrolaimus sp. JU765 TaxID=591449 RepID=A0AC34QK89_9BILA